jgi:hypothetical protein
MPQIPTSPVKSLPSATAGDIFWLPDETFHCSTPDELKQYVTPGGVSVLAAT